MKSLLTIVLLFFTLTISYGKDKDKSELFQPHGANYFTLGKDRAADDTDVKFQFSSKFNLYDIVYFSYTQKSFWDIEQESSPFRESNYNPQLFLDYKEDEHQHYIFGFEHESNGEDGLRSRSWDRFYFINMYDNGILHFSSKVWYVLEATLEDNLDIIDYQGLHEIKVGAGFVDNCQGMVTFRKRGMSLEFFYPVENFFIYTQYWTGYGQSLIDYNRPTDALWIGLSLTTGRQ